MAVRWLEIPAAQILITRSLSTRFYCMNKAQPSEMFLGRRVSLWPGGKDPQREIWRPAYRSASNSRRLTLPWRRQLPRPRGRGKSPERDIWKDGSVNLHRHFVNALPHREAVDLLETEYRDLAGIKLFQN